MFHIVNFYDDCNADLMASCLSCYSQHQKGRTYFYSSFIAYFLGLVATIFVMHYFKHAQVWPIFTTQRCASAVYAVIMCLSVCHKSEHYKDGKDGKT